MAVKRKNKLDNVKNKARIFGKLLALALVITFAHQSIAGMSSDNYQIWLDTFDAGGGLTNSSGFKVDSNLSDLNAGSSASENFSQNIVFSGIGNEPTVGFNVQTVSLDFGELSPTLTRFSSHTLNAFTNAPEGYTIKILGQSLHSDDYTIEAIGSTAEALAIGTEQFGLNLARNTLPSIGDDPQDGIGQAALNYDTANKFAFNSGDTIAYADSYSYETDFTVTAIVNIADDTPAGAYATTITYEFIPIF